MVKVTLTYFNGRGRAELIRLLFHADGFQFEDKRIEFADWPKIKPDTPSGFLPVLEIDGTKFSESLPIARFVARRHKLAGKDDMEQFLADIILNYCDELRTAMIRARMDKLLTDEQKKTLEEKNNTEVFPKFLTKMEKTLAGSKSGFLVGDGLTIADLAVLDVLDTPLIHAPNMLDKCPKVAAHRKKIQAIPAIAKYLAARPQTPI